MRAVQKSMRRAPLERRALSEEVSHRRRWRAALGRDRAHQANRDAVGILDDGIACAPEGVPWRLQSLVAGGGQLGEQAIDLLARSDTEAHDDAAAEIPA